jgi:hypothetical protein
MPETDIKTKICTKCKQRKSFDSFTKTPRNKSGFNLQSECKKCASERVRGYQKTHDHIEKQRNRRIEKRLADIQSGKQPVLYPHTAQDEIKKYRDYKESNPCVDCGKCFPYYVMQFDHIADNKVAKVSDLFRRHLWKAMWAEIAKCELVCTCCHRTRTKSRGIKSIASFYKNSRPRPRTTLKEGGDRQCSTCFRWLTTDSFWQLKKNKIPTQCHDCALDKQDVWRKAGGLERTREIKRARRREAQQFVDELKNNVPCPDCGKTKASFLMDFDHIEKKVANVATLVLAGVTLKRLKEEIARCEIVCANCHHIRTYERRMQARFEREKLKAT